MASILEGLNEAQYTAVTSPSNVLQILAPPGSGKTKTLTTRVAYLLQHHHYKPWNVICLTFTIKSSREMKERIAKLLGNGIESRLILGTFHSVCRRYLVTYGHLVGINKGFGIADSSDTTSIIKRIIKRLGLNIDPKRAQSRISSSKSRGVSHAELAQEEAKKKNVEQQEFAAVFQAYEDQLAKSNLLDYDDLLLQCADLLRQHPACVSNVEVVLIDEFQDTNIVQFDLMRLFAAKNKKVTTVGDSDQSIYGWRSAEIKNLKRMQKQFPDTLVIHLEDNYRSSGAILLAAHEVIEQDGSRPSKPLLPTHCPGTVPVLRRLPSSEIEASWIVSEILRVIALTGHLLTYSDFALLLRSAALSRLIESEMGKAGIPYRMVGGKRFFDRIEIKILLDYLRIMSQPHNNDALSRIINVPTRGIGASTAKGLLEAAEANKTSLWSLVRDAIQGHTKKMTKLSKAAEQGLGSFINIILTSRNKMLDTANPHSPEDLLRYIIKKLDFQAYLEKTHTDDHESRWANVEELIAQASEYPILDGDIDREDDSLPNIQGLQQERGDAAEEALSKFLANVALATELQREDENTEEDKPQSQVTISTIHAAKGLEWPIVFVPSAYEGSIPHSRAEDNDEERRLLYVAMTRAQAMLYMSCPVRNSNREETTLSPFLSTKKVSQYLVNSAPAINSGTANDICRILNRDCPTESQIFEASKGLQSHNDDLWPLNGQEDIEAIGAGWSKWDDDGYHVAKRRRIQENDASERTESRKAINPASAHMMSTIGTATTMQDSSTFSYVGFVSATSQLNNLVQQEEAEAKTKAPSKSQKVKGSSNSVSSLGRAPQGNLMSFWSKGGKRGAACEEPVIVEALARQAGLRHSNSHETLPASTKITLQKPTLIPTDIGDPRPRIPLSAIPQEVSKHRLRPISTTPRPHLATIGDVPARKPYVFLSSSPPPMEGPLETSEVPAEDMSHKEAMSSSENNEQAPRMSDVIPAKTFHSTSVTQLQSASKVPKKTLGVRRSMNGWAARTIPGFSVPIIAGPKS